MQHTCIGAPVVFAGRRAALVLQHAPAVAVPTTQHPIHHPIAGIEVEHLQLLVHPRGTTGSPSDPDPPPE